jgi:molecular chaperone GrpE
MNEESEKPDGAPASVGDEAPAASADGRGIGPESSPDAGAEAGGDDALAAALKEAAESRDRALRALAELENFRRRADRERQETAKYAIASFARDFLPVVDNLRRGLDSVSAEDRRADRALDALAAGMELTEREMLAALERHGIERIEPLGQPFDHNLHQAMFEVEDTAVPAGCVAQVMQAGYVLHDRLLRPALVAVAKGGVAQDTTPADDDDGEAAAGPSGAAGGAGSRDG